MKPLTFIAVLIACFMAFGAGSNLHSLVQGCGDGSWWYLGFDVVFGAVFLYTAHREQSRGGAK